jgi:hypothetical protein
VGKDVCEILELDDVSKAISRLNEGMKGANTVRTPGGPQEMITVSGQGNRIPYSEESILFSEKGCASENMKKPPALYTPPRVFCVYLSL